MAYETRGKNLRKNYKAYSFYKAYSYFLQDFGNASESLLIPKLQVLNY